MKKLDYSGAISNMKRGLLILGAAAFLAMLNPATSLAANTATAVQQAKVKVKGTVTDQTKSPVIGASVSIKGSTNGMMTDIDGKFSLDVPAGSTLTVSGIGFKPQTVKVTQAATINIVLENDNVSLEQVVVVGYGTQKKANLTGSVSSVDVNKTLDSRPITDVGRGLQGAVAGLTIRTSSGNLGSSPEIRLRSVTGSLNSSGAKPLILLDNVEIPNLMVVNPDDIESISVLKDAASSSIYGTRAAWGVVLITTKSGKKGGTCQVTYSNNFSWSTPTITPKLAKSYDNAEMALAAMKRSNPSLDVFGAVGYKYDLLSIQKMKDWEATYGGQDLGDEMVLGRDFEYRNSKLYFYRSWDPKKMFLKNWTPQQNHDLSITGGNDKTSYNVGVGYLNQEGVLKVNPDQFNRYNVTVGINSAISKWVDVRGKAMLSKTETETPYNFGNAQYDPWYYLYRWPSYFPYGTYKGAPVHNAITEVAQANMNEYNTDYNRINLGATFKLLEGLTVDADYTYQTNNTHQQFKGGTVTAWDFWAEDQCFATGSPLAYTTSANNRIGYSSIWDQTNTFKMFFTYQKSIKDHNFKLMGGTDTELYEYQYQNSNKDGLLSNDLPEINLAIGTPTVAGAHKMWATNGYFGRFNYTFKDRYLLEINGRYDGSSKFPSGDHWGFFPSASVGYRITEEPWMAPVKPVLSSLKLRGSWGSVGNQDVGYNQFIATMASTNSNWWIGSNNNLTFKNPKVVSSSLTWETVTTLDFGFDARMFKDKVGITFDWYQRNTSDMLSNGTTMPSSYGADPAKRNYGTMQTRGWELALDFNHAFPNGLSVNATATLSDFTEKITKYANTTKGLGSYYEGKTIGDIWGFETDRYFSADDFTTDVSGKSVLKDGVASQSKYESSWFKYGPGDIKYKDLNNDGVINNGANTESDHGDLKVIGNTTPRYQYSFRVGSSWKGVDVDIFFQGVGKRDLWVGGPIVIPGYSASEAWYSHQTDYWTPENANAFYPRPTNQNATADKNFLPQSKYLLDMSYLRCKNITLGYSFPKEWLSKMKIQKLRVYGSGENLFVFDNLNIPIDPEVDFTPDQSDDRAFGRAYPYRKTISIGLQVVF